jgi:hypothetical protein
LILVRESLYSIQPITWFHLSPYNFLIEFHWEIIRKNENIKLQSYVLLVLTLKALAIRQHIIYQFNARIDDNFFQRLQSIQIMQFSFSFSCNSMYKKFVISEPFHDLLEEWLKLGKSVINYLSSYNGSDIYRKITF